MKTQPEFLYFPDSITVRVPHMTRPPRKQTQPRYSGLCAVGPVPRPGPRARALFAWLHPYPVSARYSETHAARVMCLLNVPFLSSISIV